MTQGLQISMLLSTDTSLKSDSAKADAGTDGESGVFGSMFGELVQPAKTDPSDTKLRQLPAAVSPLSGISQALSAAMAAISDEKKAAVDADGSTDESASQDAEEALLAASLLDQLALKDKSRSAKATSEQAAAASSDNKEAGQDIAQLARANATAAQQAASGEMPVEANTADNNAEADSAAGQTDKAASATKQTITDAKNVALADAETTEQKSASRYDNAQIARGSKMTLDSAASADKAIPVPPEDGDISAVGVNAENAEDLAGLTQATLKAEAKSAEDKPLKTGAAKVKAAADDASVAQGAKLSAEDAPALTGAGAINVLSPDETTAADTEQKTSNASAAEKLLKPDGDKTDSKSGAKQGSEQSGQQQQRQNSSAQLTADLQQMADSQQQQPGARSVADASALRSDALFSSSLHTAEQRQQTGAVRTVQHSAAEQLKQSLNLQQQDAAGQLRERVNLMVRQNIQVAEIRLDPAGLGQMQIKIDMQQEQASVQFVVQQPQAKEALEQHMPRLREMLQQQGITLSEGNVQQQSQQQERQLAQRDGNGGGRHQAGHDGGDDSSAPAPAVQVTATVNDRLVDYYA
ncbi:flagellar hook-length control protein FliK [Rheinheimera aquimaris]|uniref:flagellar hook-length control protein FliK n=1 Tax=Rheinheimera aquimaris TaxID=412437 RepID=UPI003A97DE98